MGRRAQIAGMKFGELTAVSINVERSGRLTFWNCECRCGGRHIAAAKDLISGNTKSCGCLSREKQHGMVGSPEYESWTAMKTRCNNPNHSSYHRYGGRGISVCARWADDFTAFLADMGPRPEGMCIERVDNNGNYEPGNCRWATAKQQSRNKVTNRVVQIGGTRRTLAEWADVYGLNRTTLRHRLNKGWSALRAVTTPTTKENQACHLKP